MSDYRIEAATKEEWAERALRAEVALVKALGVLEKISAYDHQKTAMNCLLYYLPTRNMLSLQESLLSIAATDTQAWAKAAIAQIKRS